MNRADRDPSCPRIQGGSGESTFQPQLLLARLIGVLGRTPVTLESVEDGKTKLSALLLERACLLVLDDVWQPDHAAPFQVLGERCRLLPLAAYRPTDMMGPVKPLHPRWFLFCVSFFLRTAVKATGDLGCVRDG
jgi:hypothetical protein